TTGGGRRLASLARRTRRAVAGRSGRADHGGVRAGDPGGGRGGPGADRLGQIVGEASGLLRQDHRRHHQQLLLMEPRRRRSGTGERASAAVEFALVLPLVLVMTLAL